MIEIKTNAQSLKQLFLLKDTRKKVEVSLKGQFDICSSNHPLTHIYLYFLCFSNRISF